MYHYKLLTDTSLAHDPCYGIELDDPDDALLCLYGNLFRWDRHGLLACTQSIFCDLPPDDAVLVTEKVDVNRVAAMAILTLRLEKHPVNTELVIELATGSRSKQAAYLREIIFSEGPLSLIVTKLASELRLQVMDLAQELGWW